MSEVLGAEKGIEELFQLVEEKNLERISLKLLLNLFKTCFKGCFFLLKEMSKRDSKEMKSVER